MSSAQTALDSGGAMNDNGSREQNPRIGAVLLDKYRLDAVLGCGGMGVVYRATQLPIDRPVAIKLITCDASARRPDTQQRFRREAEAMAKLRHPNTVRLFDFGVTPGSELFIVMELLEGRDLAEHLSDKGALPLAEALQIMRDALGSLSEAHAIGIVHRDIKPANIYLSRLQDGRLTVKLMDFGVASIQQSIDTPKLTIAGAVMGTPAYMSPEQASGRAADARSDLYSLGITLFQMLTGRVPFEAESVAPVLVAHLAQPVPRLTEICPGSNFDPSVQALLDVLLHKAPEQRPANASEALQLVEALTAELHASKRLTTGPVIRAVAPKTAAASSTPPVSVPKTMLATMFPSAREGVGGGRDKRWLWAGALVLGVLSAGAAGAWRFAGPAPSEAKQERDEVRTESSKTVPDLHFETSTSALSASAEPPQQAAVAALTVMVRSSPNAAAVSRAGRELGRTPLNVTVDQPMRVTLKLQDYQPQDLFLNADSKQDLTVKLLPLAAIAVAPVPPAPPPPPPPVDTSRARAPTPPPPPPAQGRNLGKTLSMLMSMPRRDRQQFMLNSGAPYPNVVAAKQALRDDIVDSAMYKDIIWVLKTQREQRIDAEKLKYKSGAITRDEYDRRVEQIEHTYEGK